MSNLHANCHVKNMNRKMDHHTRVTWRIHVSKHRNESQLLILEPPCWLSLGKYVNLMWRIYIVTFVIRFSQRKSVYRPIERRQIHAETSSHELIILIKYSQPLVQDDQCLERWFRHKLPIPPTFRHAWHFTSIRHLNINCTLPHNSC